MNWLILTTRDLPEAYVMADHLLRKAQRVFLLNISGRTRAQRFAVLQRLAKKRGLGYLADLLLGRLLRSRYLDAGVRPFPEITADVMAGIKQECSYHEVADPHAPATLQYVAEVKPDYILFLGAPVIKPELFTLARVDALNWHHGIAPRYRGSDCVLWAMAKNEFDQVGFTIHSVAAVVDGGRIILQRTVPVRKDVSCAGAVADVARQGLQGFIEVIDRLLAGHELESRKQEPGGTHYPPIGWRALRRAARNFQHYAAT